MLVNNIFLQISVLLGITVSVAFIVRLMRQPLIIAYIIAGIVAGPIFLGVLDGNQQSFESFAQFGVVLLLFVVGPRHPEQQPGLQYRQLWLPDRGKRWAPVDYDSLRIMGCLTLSENS